MQNHNDDTIKTSDTGLWENIPLTLFERVQKGYSKVLQWEGVGDWTELQHIDPPYSYGHNCVSFPFSWAAQPGAWEPSLSGTWSSFQHLLSNWSDLQLLNRGSWGPPLLGAGFLYHILSPTGLISNCSIGCPEGPLSWVLVFSTASYLQLIELPVHRVI